MHDSQNHFELFKGRKKSINKTKQLYKGESICEAIAFGVPLPSLFFTELGLLEECSSPWMFSWPQCEWHVKLRNPFKLA